MESPANINGPSLPVRSTATRSITLPIWQPTTPEADIPIVQYREHINNKFSLSLRSSRQLHAWSVTDPQAFWVDLWNYVGLVPRLDPHINHAYDPSVPMSDIPRFFEGQCLNYAENVLTQPHVDGLSVALVGIREGCSIEGEKWSWNELREHVRVLASSMTESGICPGDRLAAIISTSVWSVAIFLAAASIGAIYTSIASDLGEQVKTILSLKAGTDALRVVPADWPKWSRSYSSPTVTSLSRASREATSIRFAELFHS